MRRAISRLIGACRALVFRDRVNAELDDELREYLTQATEAKIAAGMRPDDAARLARAEMGSAAALTDRVNDVGWESRLESIWQDARYAVRVLARSPGFTAVAVLTFALGVGTNIAVFMLSDGMLFRPLPYRDPERLVLIQGYSVREAQAYSRVGRIDFEQLRSHHTGFEGVATASAEGSLTWMGGDGAVSISTSYATPNLLQLLGVGAHIGRPLAPGDETMEPRAAMLTFDAWQRRFGGDPGMVGRTLAFEQGRVQIVGVLPRRFIFPLQGRLGEGEVLFVRDLDPKDAANPRAGVWTPIARLKDGVSIAQAQAETDLLVSRTAKQFPETPQGTLRVANLQYALFELSRSLLWLLIAAGGGVLLIACVNLANLLLARGASREREIGIRTAIGASRSRVARQLIVESLVLGVLAGGLALVVMGAAFDAIAAQIPARYRLIPPGLDGRTILFAFALSMAASVLFGVAPALRLASADASAALKESRRAARGSRPVMRAGAVLVAVQIALCFVLLAATALTANSLIRRRTLDIGIGHKDVVQLRFALHTSRYPTREQVYDFDTRVLDEIRRLPNVNASAIDFAQIGDSAPWMHAVADGIPKATGVWGVMPGYFKTMGIPMTAGRDFSDAEIQIDAPVAIVSESVARALWPGDRAEGQVLVAEKLPPLTVVGVVRDVRRGYGGELRPAVYRPLARGRNRWMTIMARTPGDAGALGQAMRTIVQRMDPRLVVPTPLTVSETLNRGIADPQFQTSLFALFGLVGLLVAAVGIYGVMAHWVNSRTREFGVRLALGAEPSRLRALVIAQASVPLAAGLFAGLLGAFVLTKRLQNLLYDVTPTDPVTLGTATIVLAVVGLTAAYMPARRAARVDPIVVLRAE